MLRILVPFAALRRPLRPTLGANRKGLVIMPIQESIPVVLNAQELRYLVACGAALIQNIPAESLHTYCRLDQAEIVAFSTKIRRLMEENGIDL